MNYSVNYKTLMPYSIWHEDIHNLKKHIEERCKEITVKYDTNKELYENDLFKEYAKGEDFGKVFEQHNDPSLDIRQNKNKELISLESEMKSTLEKVLKDIVNGFNLSTKQGKNKESYLFFYIRLIEEGKQIDMSKFDIQKNIISDMIKKRNDSEHNTDNLLRNIDVQYITNVTNAIYDYADALIRELYNKKQ